VTTSAQMVIRDEAHLFTLLDGLPEDKKNLLTYLFERHDARSSVSDGDHSGMDKLEKEMKRLDNRTSTSPRPSVG
jgi:CLIP-associating protein 1/2